MAKIKEQFDILIVGGGLVGSVLATALKDSPLKVGLVEAHPYQKGESPGLDGRSFALSEASVRILSELKLWPSLEAHATLIKKIHISERYGWAQARLEAKDYQMDAFGAVLEHDHLMDHFYNILSESSNIHLMAPARVVDLTSEDDGVSVTVLYGGKQIKLRTEVLVAADGGNSMVRKSLNIPLETYCYEQYALVCNVKLNRHHKNTAYERFLGHEMMAMLPLTQHRQAVVWAMDKSQCDERLGLSKDKFLQVLQKTFGYRLGRLVDVGVRKSFPLTMSYLDKTVFDRVVFIGNAAHTLHPIAGQGFNLGLRDVAYLAELLLDKRGDCFNNLSKMNLLRSADQEKTRQFTHGLIQLFTQNSKPLTLLRSFGLCAFDHMTPVKKELVHFAAGFSSKNSRLVSGLPAEK